MIIPIKMSWVIQFYVLRKAKINSQITIEVKLQRDERSPINTKNIALNIGKIISKMNRIEKDYQMVAESRRQWTSSVIIFNIMKWLLPPIFILKVDQSTWPFLCKKPKWQTKKGRRMQVIILIFSKLTKRLNIVTEVLLKLFAARQ